MRRLILLFATGLGAGKIPYVPGTCGTIVGVGLFFLIKDLPAVAYAMTLVTFSLIAVWTSSQAADHLGQKDPSSVVIDEIAGFLVTMAFIKFSWVSLVIGFILFRLFDIWKPFPCRWIQDRVPGGWGIVGDDLMAGIYANLILRIFLLFL